VSTRSTLVDTGPLVALLNRNDPYHQSCAAVAAQLELPMVTSWLVIAEAAWLLRRSTAGPVPLLRLITDKVIECVELGVDGASWMTEVMGKYSDLSPQLADVSLLYLAHTRAASTVFTLDRRDFLIYRTSTGGAFTLLPDAGG
jgi:predicted nucleic acid-binding protein